MTANQTEAEAWNAERGADWVRLQPVLDHLMSEITDVLRAEAAAQPGEAVIDIGCGSGATALEVAAQVKPGGRVLGVDISVALLDHARRRAEAAGIGNLSFVLADAETHPFDPDSADLLISRFGVMFFDDSLAAFRNLARALRPGGRMVLAAWAGPEHNPWFSLPTRAAVSRLGPVEPTPPTAPGPMAFQGINRVTGLMQDAGLTGAAGRMVPVRLFPPVALEDATRLALDLGPVSRILKAKGGTEADSAAIRDALRAELSAFVTAQGVVVPGAVNLFTARRPD